MEKGDRLKVLVTGGSGFIGAEVVKSLLARGFTVANFDIAPPCEQHRSLWFAGDLTDRDRLRTCIAEVAPDAIMHLAARTEIGAETWDAFASIHEGTRNLITAIEEQGGVSRLLNVSTQLVIGPQHRPRSPLDFRPYTTYGEAKAYAEALLLQWQSPVHWLTVRPATIWGPHHPHLPQAMWKYIRRRVYLHPAARAPVLRSYGYVRNTAEQMVRLLLCEPQETYRQVYYAADAVMDSALWVDAFSRALTGSRARRVPVPVLKALGYAGDAMRVAGMNPPIDSGRAMRITESYPVPLEPTWALTGKPAVSLEEGVAETVAWLKQREAASDSDNASGS